MWNLIVCHFGNAKNVDDFKLLLIEDYRGVFHTFNFEHLARSYEEVFRLVIGTLELVQESGGIKSIQNIGLKSKQRGDEE